MSAALYKSMRFVNFWEKWLLALLRPIMRPHYILYIYISNSTRKEKFATVCRLINHRAILPVQRHMVEIFFSCKSCSVKASITFSNLSFARTRECACTCARGVNAHVYNLSPLTSRTVSSFSFFAAHPRWLRPCFPPLKQYRTVDQSFTNREINLSCILEVPGKNKDSWRDDPEWRKSLLFYFFL